MTRRSYTRFAHPPPPHEVTPRQEPLRYNALIDVRGRPGWLTCLQVCCVAGIKRGLLDACESYKSARRGDDDSGGNGNDSSASYNTFVNDVLCIMQDLTVQHLKVSKAPFAPFFDNHTRVQRSCLYVYACDCLCRVSLQVRFQGCCRCQRAINAAAGGRFGNVRGCTIPSYFLNAFSFSIPPASTAYPPLPPNCSGPRAPCFMLLPTSLLRLLHPLSRPSHHTRVMRQTPLICRFCTPRRRKCRLTFSSSATGIS
jgi:hypothetical protein